MANNQEVITKLNESYDLIESLKKPENSIQRVFNNTTQYTIERNIINLIKQNEGVYKKPYARNFEPIQFTREQIKYIDNTNKALKYINTIKEAYYKKPGIKRKTLSLKDFNNLIKNDAYYHDILIKNRSVNYKEHGIKVITQNLPEKTLLNEYIAYNPDAIPNYGWYYPELPFSIFNNEEAATVNMSDKLLQFLNEKLIETFINIARIYYEYDSINIKFKYHVLTGEIITIEKLTPEEKYERVASLDQDIEEYEISSFFRFTKKSFDLKEWFKFTKGDINMPFDMSHYSDLFKEGEMGTFNAFIRLIIYRSTDYKRSGLLMIRRIIVGYQVLVAKIDNFNKEEFLKTLTSFGTMDDKKYHKMTVASTRDNQLCLFDTFMYCYNNIPLLRIKKYSKQLDNTFNDLPKKIKDYIQKGLFYYSYIELTKHFKTSMHVLFYGIKDKIIKFDNGDVKIINNENDLIDKLKVGLYYKHHIAPAIYDKEFLENMKKEIKKNQSDYFSLKPEYRKEINKKIICGAFDAETYGKKLEEGGLNQVSFLIIIKIGDKENTNSFYGENCVNEFVDYLFKIVTFSKNHKASMKEAVPQIVIWGFNCSGYDNFLIYTEIFYKCPSTKMIYSNGKIKMITFGNIRIYDLNLFYTGKLSKVAESFKLDVTKDIFPYKFYKSPKFHKNDKLNLHYKGKLPAIEYWNKKEEYDEYIHNNNPNSLFYINDELINDINYKDTKEKEIIEKLNNNNKNFINFQKYKKIIINNNIKKLELGDKNFLLKLKGMYFDLEFYSKYYCNLDTEITYKLANLHMKSCIGKLNGRYYDVRLCPTVGSLAIKFYRQVFQTEEIKAGLNKEIRAIERSVVGGGVTEVFNTKFRQQNENDYLYYYDINSAHAHSMLEKMPKPFTADFIKKYRIIKNIDDFNKEKIVDSDLYLVDCTYKGNDKNYIPNLSEKGIDGKIVYVKNLKNKWAFGEEIKCSVRTGCEIIIKNSIIYASFDMFSDCIKFLYKERVNIKESNPALAQFYKAIIVNLYGKWGQNNYTNTVFCCDSSEIYDILNNPNNILINFEAMKNGKGILLEYKDKKSDRRNIGNLCVISAYIASRTRCKLFNQLYDIGYENAYYADTDSIFSKKKFNDNIVSKTELGKWKLEHRCIEGNFFGRKMYQTKSNEVEDRKKLIGTKGVPKDNVTDEDFEKIKNNETAIIKMNLFKRELEAGINIYEDYERSISKTLTARKYFSDGSSEPFENIDEYNQSIRNINHKNFIINSNLLD